jgi:hypothetical protein
MGHFEEFSLVKWAILLFSVRRRNLMHLKEKTFLLYSKTQVCNKNKDFFVAKIMLARKIFAGGNLIFSWEKTLLEHI